MASLLESLKMSSLLKTHESSGELLSKGGDADATIPFSHTEPDEIVCRGLREFPLISKSQWQHYAAKV